MARIRIIKKNDEFNSEYDIGDIFEITGTWYGGVHITGKSGIPVSLDKDEYMELDTEPEPDESFSEPSDTAYEIYFRFACSGNIYLQYDDYEGKFSEEFQRRTFL